MRWKVPKLPFAPLRAVALSGRPLCRAGECECNDGLGGRNGNFCYGIPDLAADMGVTTRTIHRWAKDGVPADRGDELAVRLGTTPFYVWGLEWERYADAEAEYLLGRKRREPDPDWMERIDKVLAA